MQLYQPLSFFGFVYREIKQGLIDIEEMFDLLAESEEITDAPGARDLAVDGGRIEFDGVAFGYDARRPTDGTRRCGGASRRAGGVRTGDPFRGGMPEHLDHCRLRWVRG